MPDETKYFTRLAASQWFVAKGLAHYTRATLANLAHKGTGPAYSMIGARAFYELKDLDGWLPKAFSKPKEGCGPKRDAA